jgi:hypothetical protein
MIYSPESRTSVAALRPWPFGPPLRGRALRSDAGSQAAPTRAFSLLESACRTMAPVGGLSFDHLLRCTMRRSCLITTKMCQTEIRT